MAGFLKLRAVLDPISSLPLLHKALTLTLTSLSSSSIAALKPPNPSLPSVAVFWDLTNPPKSIPLSDAAVRLRLAAASFGSVPFAAAFASRHATAARRTKPAASADRHVCRVCGRRFHDGARLVAHFHHLHERENAKRLHRLESARGARRVKLAAQFSMKTAKYNNAAQQILAPKSGRSLEDELRRAGVVVRTDDRNEALRARMVDEMNRGRIGCFVLVSDDAELVGVLREARRRRVTTVVVGDEKDGVLKRFADAGFSWKEVVSGKARKAGESAVVRWKDKDLLKRLEWDYEPENEDIVGEIEGGDGGDESFGLMGKRGSGPWWKLDSESDEPSEGGRLAEGYEISAEGRRIPGTYMS